MQISITLIETRSHGAPLLGRLADAGIKGIAWIQRVPPLTPQEAEHLHLHVPQWEIRDEARRIERTFRVRNFREAFALVQQVAELAEAEGHHPDISFGWGYITVMMQTKKIKGLHDNDFIMAAKIDRLSEPVVLPSIGP